MVASATHGLISMVAINAVCFGGVLMNSYDIGVELQWCNGIMVVW